MNLDLWKKIKAEKGLTIEQIAIAAKLPKGSVQNIFCGYVTTPRIDTVEAIEKALGITGVIMNLDLWKKIKAEKGLTIEQIAIAAKLPKGSVQNIFCGYVPTPRIDTVEAIEKALGITDEKNVITDTFTADERELVELYRTLSPFLKNTTLETVRTWAGKKALQID